MSKDQPFKKGDIVLQKSMAGVIRDYARVIYADSYGGLDVVDLITGQQFGWSARMCDPVFPTTEVVFEW